MGEVGHGFSMTGSLGVEAEIFVRGNYFTENSDTDIEIPAVNAYVCANYVDTSSDLSFSGPIIAWGNRFLSNLPCYAFILSTLAKHQGALCTIVAEHTVFRQFLTES